MKKFLALSMAAVMIFSIAACSKEEDAKNAEETTTTAEETTTAVETTEETEPPVVLTTVSLVDEERGYTVTISFPEDAGINVTELTADNGSPELLIEDGDNQMWFFYDYDVSYSNVAPSEIDPSSESERAIAAVNVNGFVRNSSVYNTGWYELVDADGNVLPDCLKISNRYYAATSDAMTQGTADYFNNEMFISILESVTFEYTSTAE